MWLTRFPALGAGYMHLPRILIGSLHCLCLLWLARLIALLLVLRHSIEKRFVLLLQVNLLYSPESRNDVYSFTEPKSLPRGGRGWTKTLWEGNDLRMLFHSTPKCFEISNRIVWLNRQRSFQHMVQQWVHVWHHHTLIFLSPKITYPIINRKLTLH